MFESGATTGSAAPTTVPAEVQLGAVLTGVAAVPGGVPVVVPVTLPVVVPVTLPVVVPVGVPVVAPVTLPGAVPVAAPVTLPVVVLRQDAGVDVDPADEFGPVPAAAEVLDAPLAGLEPVDGMLGDVAEVPPDCGAIRDSAVRELTNCSVEPGGFPERSMPS